MILSESWSRLLEEDLREISDVMSSVTISREKLLPGERREVASLFIDLHGFTAMSEELDHETVHRLSSGIMRALSRTIEAHGGYLDKYEGDKIMALFGAVRSHTDDCERAVSAGLRMLEIVDEIRGILHERGISIGARVGISYGPVTVAPDPSGHLTASGDEVNIAARMESSAEVGTVQVTKCVREQCGDSFTWLDLGKQKVRGRKSTVHAFQPTGHGMGLMQRKQEASDLDWKFVNRKRELAVLGESISDSEEDRPGCRMLLLRGFDGTGKTRLSMEFAAGFNANENTVLYGETSPYAQNAFQLWLSALSGCSGTLVQANTTLNEDTSENTEIDLSSIDCVMDLMGIRSWPKANEMSPSLLREKQVTSIMKVLQRIAQNSLRKKLLIIADNLQWTDSSSAEVLSRLLTSEEETADILIIGCIDPTGLSEKQWMDLLLEHLSEKIRVIDVPPFDKNSTLQLISTILNTAGTTDPREISDLLLDRTFSRSSGNPFITVELIKLLIESGILKRHNSGWDLSTQTWDEILPDSVRGLIRCRIDSLALPDRRILQIAALVGRRFDSSVITQVVKQLDTDLEESLDQSLSILVREGILVEVSLEMHKVFEFSSTTFQEIASATVLRQNRISIHRVTAEQMTVLYQKELGRYAYDISLHWREADRLDKAIETGILAIDYLAETYQNEECLALADLIESWVVSDPPAESGDVIMTILIKRQKIQYRLARFQEMDRTLQKQLKLVESRGFDAELGKTYCSLGELRRVQRDYPQAREYLAKAIDYSRRSGDLNTLGMSLSNLGALHHGSGESELAIRNIKEAISVQEECGNLQSAGIAMLNLASVLIDTDDVDKGKVILNRSLAHFGKISFKTGEAHALSHLGTVAEREGRLEEAVEMLQKAADLLEETGYRHGLGPVLSNLGRLQMQLASEEEAETTLLSALEQFSVVSDPENEVLTLVSLGTIALRNRRLEESSKYCSKAMKLISENGQSIKPETIHLVEDIQSELLNSKQNSQ